MIRIENQTNPNAILPEDRNQGPLTTFTNCYMLRQSNEPLITVDECCDFSVIMTGTTVIDLPTDRHKIIRLLKFIKRVWKIL